ncbi:MAG: PCRF domain-containing protein, partial [Spirochaetota bacterium]|nr:PCRF domain-containing protein [Spirochaetota bacterium]
MIKKLDSIVVKCTELEKEISDPDIMKDMDRYKKVMQEYSHIKETTDLYSEYKIILSEIEGAKTLISEENDSEMKEMAKEELSGLEDQGEKMEKALKLLLVPRDPMDGKNIIMEIRAGTGGDEAALFAADLYRMYTKFAESHKWKTEVMSTNEIGIGGFKEIAFSISGKEVYGTLRYESGVHRVQRVPATESGGRVHTSAVTVAVLPEAEETDIKIKNEELKIDVFRSSGPGGQSVNTTD